MPKLIPPPHPGETILEDILKPLGMSVNQLAKALGITAARLNDIVRGRRGITADTALRLARYLGTSAEFWLGLQLEYDLARGSASETKGHRTRGASQVRSGLSAVCSGPQEPQPPPALSSGSCHGKDLGERFGNVLAVIDAIGGNA